MTGIGKLQRSGKGKTIEDAKKDMNKQKFTGDCKGYVPVAAYIETWQNSGPFGQLLEQQVF